MLYDLDFLPYEGIQGVIRYSPFSQYDLPACLVLVVDLKVDGIVIRPGDFYGRFRFPHAATGVPFKPVLVEYLATE